LCGGAKASIPTGEIVCRNAKRESFIKYLFNKINEKIDFRQFCDAATTGMIGPQSTYGGGSRAVGINAQKHAGFAARQ
jgi:hypothetical protein